MQQVMQDNPAIREMSAHMREVIAMEVAGIVALRLIVRVMDRAPSADARIRLARRAQDGTTRTLVTALTDSCDRQAATLARIIEIEAESTVQEAA